MQIEQSNRKGWEDEVQLYSIKRCGNLSKQRGLHLREPSNGQLWPIIRVERSSPPICSKLMLEY